MRRATTCPGAPGPRRQRGAAAVELALVAPILVALAAGIVDFGFRYQQNIQYTNAAMQGARQLAITDDPAVVTTDTRAFIGNSTATVNATVCSSTNRVASVSIQGTRSTLTGMFGQNFTITAAGSVRCP